MALHLLNWFFMLWFVLCLMKWYLQHRAQKPRFGFKHRPTIQSISSIASTPKNQRKPEWVRVELIRLAALCKGSRRNVARLFNRLHAERLGVSVGHSFTCGFLKTHAVQVLRLRREMNSRTPRVVPICHTWAMDLTFYTDEQRMTHVALGIIDHGSRLLLCLQILTIRNSWTMLGYLCLTIAQYGKPKRLRSDNEAVFNSFVFKTFLRLLGIKKQTSDVACPWQNGRIERLFGTVKPVLRQLRTSGINQLQKAFDEFKLFYNHADSFKFEWANACASLTISIKES